MAENQPRQKWLWYTDLHLDKVMPWRKRVFLNSITRERPDGIILTGDISNGRYTVRDLELIADAVSCPIWFCLGNHDYHGSSFGQTHADIRELCVRHPNLIWLTEAGVVPINDEVAIIGTEGWYDAEEGKPEYLQFTFDWFLIDDFRVLSDMKARIKAWRKLAEKSAEQITKSLEQAIDEGYKTIYIATHIPPWREATRDVGTFMEKFWLPYNTNLHLGKAIEKVMADHKKRHVMVVCGHTHTPLEIRIAHNVECRVGPGHYLGLPKEDKQVLYI